MKRFLLSFLLLLGALVIACSGQTTTPKPKASAASEPTFPPPPETKTEAVSETYHGIDVEDPYRWLEDGTQELVKDWTEKQNEYARSHLDSLAARDVLRRRLNKILKGGMEAYWAVTFAGGKTFAKKFAPPKQQPVLVVADDIHDAESISVVFDPEAHDETGKTTMDWYKPSPNGALVAISLSKAGTERGDVYVFSVATGKQLYEVVPAANSGTAGGDLAWDSNSKGFYYTRHPQGDERPVADHGFYQQVYFHRLGTPASKDRYQIGKKFPRIAETELKMDHKSGRLLVTVQKGDGGEFEHHLRTRSGRWIRLSEFGDGIIQAEFGKPDEIYLLTTGRAPRGRISRIWGRRGFKNAEIVIGQHESDTIVNNFWGPPSFVVTDRSIYVTYQTGGPSEIRVFDLNGDKRVGPDQLPVSSVSNIVPLDGDDVLFLNGSYTEPSAVFHYRAKEQSTTKTALASKAPVDLSGVQVVREFAVSKDDTKVPVNILLPPGATRLGNTPLVLYGYGGYGVSLEPRFSASRSVLLDNGVAFAVANLRGGGEYGKDWHRQGNLTNKQNVFDDFAAVANHLVDKGYTSHDRLGLQGGSNGGLLMGAMLTQHPGLARAVASHVGIYDMLRFENHPNGTFNTTEFGSVKDKGQFEALRAYSPYHNVRPAKFPAVLLTTGLNDPRVDPMNSRKMAAMLQRHNQGQQPIILRTSADTGHGAGTPLDERIEELVDEYAFFMHHLRVTPRSASDTATAKAP